MAQTVEEVATDILVEIFRNNGWKCKHADINKLREAVSIFIKDSRKITEGDYSNGYAIISRRIMKSVHENKKAGPSNTEMGKKLFKAEKKLIRAMELLKMYDYFDEIPQFTLIVTSKVEQRKTARTLLLYSRDFGFSLECVGLDPPIEDDGKIHIY